MATNIFRLPPGRFQYQKVAQAQPCGPRHTDILFNFRFSTASTEKVLKAKSMRFWISMAWNMIAWELSGKPYLTAQVVWLRNQQSDSTILWHHTGALYYRRHVDGRFIADICPQVIDLPAGMPPSINLHECVGVADIDRLN